MVDFSPQHKAIETLLSAQSTCFDYQTLTRSAGQFAQKVISSMDFWGAPANCPHNHHTNRLVSPLAHISSCTTYGGPGSKYKQINEDSFFFGYTKRGNIFSGVIDGAGGSKYGYLGGKLANEMLSTALKHGRHLDEAFKMADDEVLNRAFGGYATGVALTIDQKQNIVLGCKGDARAITIRENILVPEGCTKAHSLVAKQIEDGDLPPSAIHTGPRKNVIYSVIGNKMLPYFQTKFSGKAGDQIVLGSDGLFDVVSDHEIIEMSKIYTGSALQSRLYALAYSRNNSKRSFFIRFNAKEEFEIPPLFRDGIKRRGDNITVQVIELR